MTNTSRFTTAILALMTIITVLAIAGCTSTQSPATPTPTPVPSATPTPTATPSPAPGNQTMEREYQYVERLTAGTNHYNEGIMLIMVANNSSKAGDYSNASQTMLTAKDQMDAAASDFRAMKQYANSPTEISFGDKWTEIAEYESMSAQNASEAFAEFAYQMARPEAERNLVRANGYVEQANHYSSLASEVRKQADALQGMITFIAPTPKP